MGRKNFVDGHYWVWNTTKSWSEQIGVFDERTIKSNLKSLRDRGIVITANHNKTSYDRTIWYRLDYFVLAQAIEKDPESSQLHDPLGNCITTHSEATSQTIPKTISETTTEIPWLGAAPLSDENIHLIEEPPMPKSTGTAAAILAEFANKGPVSKSANSSGSLQSLWKHHVPKHNPEVKFIPEFTIKHKGQFGLLAKSLGSRADVVLTHVVKNWVGFSKFVAAQTGIKQTPDSPELGFLLKNAGVAANFYLAAHAKTEKPLPKKVDSVIPKPSVQLTAQKTDTASVEDVMAWKS